MFVFMVRIARKRRTLFRWHRCALKFHPHTISRYLSNQTQELSETSATASIFNSYVARSSRAYRSRFPWEETTYWFVRRTFRKVALSRTHLSCSSSKKASVWGLTHSEDIIWESSHINAKFEGMPRLVREVSRYYWKTKRSLHKLYRHPIFINYIDNLHKLFLQSS